MTWSGYQKKKLFRNLDGHAFKEMSAEAGVDNDKDGRGIGVGDFDNDGRLDFYQTNADQDSLLYHNASTGHRPLGRAQADRHDVESRRDRRARHAQDRRPDR